MKSVFIGILACAVPCGALFGVYLGQLDPKFTSNCLAMAVGTFLYVGIMHILPEEFDEARESKE